MKPSNQIEEIKIAEEDESDFGRKMKIFSYLKSRTLWLIITLLVATMLLLIAIPGFFNNSSLKFQIEQKTSQLLNTNLTINGQVQAALFPYPAIIAENVLLQNYKKDGQVYNLYARSVQIKLSLFKFLAGDFVIKKILLSDATLETYYEANSATPRHNKFSEVVAQFPVTAIANPDQKPATNNSSGLFAVEKFQPSQFSTSSLPTVQVKNGVIISYDNFSYKREVEEINGSVMIDAKKIRASGEFTNEKIKNNFKLTASFNSEAGKENSVLELDSPAMSLTVKGSFTSENRGIFNSDFGGKIEAEIFDIRSFYQDYVSNNSAIFEKLKQNSQSIKISGEIKNNGGAISLDNLVINSDLVNGKGGVAIDLTSDLPRVDVNLDLENLDLDNIWSSDRVALDFPNQDYTRIDFVKDDTAEALNKNAQPVAADTTKNVAGLNLQNADKIKDFDLISEVKIKNVKYLEGDIKDLNLYLTISKKGQVLLLPMIFTIPGEGTMRINGALENSHDLPRFIGTIDVSGKNLGDSIKWLQIDSPNLKFDNLKNYTIYSDVMLLPNQVILDNLYLNLNNDQSEFLGEIRIDSRKKITNITNKFWISSFNIDDFFLTSGQNIYLSRGSLLRKLLWLNEIPSNNDIALTFGKLIYKGQEFSKESSLKFLFGQGYLKVTELNLHSDKINLQANMAIDISAQIPAFNMNIIADNFYYKSTSPQTKGGKENLAAKKVTAVDQIFLLPSLEGFSGGISFVTTKLNLDNSIFNNVKIGGTLKDGNIPDGLVTCDMYDGNFKYVGLIGIKDNKTLNGILSFANASLEKLLPDLIGVKNIKAVANISANITSAASSKEDFIQEASSEIRFNANAPEVGGYGLTDLVNKMFYIENFRQDLQDPEKILLNPEGKTYFKQASGKVTFSKDKDGAFSIKLTAPAVNGILSGKVNLLSNSIDGLSNIIFVTGTKQKQVPLNIATAIKGDMKSMSSNTNLNQVKQYLGVTLPKSVPAADSAAAPTATPPAEAIATSAPIATAPTSNSNIPNPQQKIIEAQKELVMEKLRAITADPSSYAKEQKMNQH